MEIVTETPSLFCTQEMSKERKERARRTSRAKKNVFPPRLERLDFDLSRIFFLRANADELLSKWRDISFRISSSKEGRSGW